MIELDHDGRYQKAILFDDKSYVLQDWDGEKTLKGNTLTSRSSEAFVLRFIRRAVDHLLEGEPEKIRDDYDYYAQKIELKMMSLQEVAKTQNINMTLREYRNKVEAGQAPIAQYEAALRSDKDYMKGDSITTWLEEPAPQIREYKTVPDKEYIPKKASYEVIRLADEYNGNIYRDHYQSRLDKTVKKLLVVLGLDTFKEMFPELSILKPDRAKMLEVWGYEKFNERFPDFGWRQQDYEKLSPEEKEQFRDDHTETFLDILENS